MCIRYVLKGSECVLRHDRTQIPLLTAAGARQRAFSGLNNSTQQDSLAITMLARNYVVFIYRYSN